MSHTQNLKLLLRPMGVYAVDAPLIGGELDSQGLALDGAEQALDEVLREGCLLTAQGWGLDLAAALFRVKPVAEGAAALGQALRALMRVGGDSFTLRDINAAISGCGVRARVEEGDGPGRVTVFFPQVPGVPAGFEEIQTIIEDILPAHLDISYAFWFMTWRELERKLNAWSALEGAGLNWTQLETYVQD